MQVTTSRQSPCFGSRPQEPSSAEAASPTVGTHLVAILSNPPRTTGDRTRARVELARKTLGFECVSLANIFSLATHSTGQISHLGREADGWLMARDALGSALQKADAVLLAYGSSLPIGDARKHHREQLSWLRAELSRIGVPLWQLGSQPYHPSRWQRWTSRHVPEMPFADALKVGLNLVPLKHDVGRVSGKLDAP